MEEKGKTSIERLGYSQALTEITILQGPAYTKMMLVKYLTKIKDERAWVKAGYIGMFIYFPVLMGDEFG